jgi:hypothetical protein
MYVYVLSIAEEPSMGIRRPLFCFHHKFYHLHQFHIHLVLEEDFDDLMEEVVVLQVVVELSLYNTQEVVHRENHTDSMIRKDDLDLLEIYEFPQEMDNF